MFYYCLLMVQAIAVAHSSSQACPCRIQRMEQSPARRCVGCCGQLEPHLLTFPLHSGIAVSTPPRMLTLLYLLNDVLLQGRKKGDDYIAAFQPHLQEAMSLIYGHGDAKVRASAERVLNIWMERQVYAVEELKAVRSRLNQPRLAVRPAPQPAPLTPKVQPDVVEANVHIMPMDLTEGDIDVGCLVCVLHEGLLG